MEKPTNKTLALVLAFAPLVAIFLYVFFFISMVIEIRDDRYGSEVPDGLIPMLVSIGLLVIVSLGSMIYFIIHAVQNPRLNSDHKLIWALVNFFGGTIGHVIYYFLVINNERDSDFTGKLD